MTTYVFYNSTPFALDSAHAGTFLRIQDPGIEMNSTVPTAAYELEVTGDWNTVLSAAAYRRHTSAAHADSTSDDIGKHEVTGSGVAGLALIAALAGSNEVDYSWVTTMDADSLDGTGAAETSSAPSWTLFWQHVVSRALNPLDTNGVSVSREALITELAISSTDSADDHLLSNMATSLKGNYDKAVITEAPQVSNSFFGALLYFVHQRFGINADSRLAADPSEETTGLALKSGDKVALRFQVKLSEITDSRGATAETDVVDSQIVLAQV